LLAGIRKNYSAIVLHEFNAKVARGTQKKPWDIGGCLVWN